MNPTQHDAAQKRDFLVIGGGVIGLSIAYVLAQRGAGVQVLDSGRMGRQASWAGAGILPPANRDTATHPLEQLHGLSHRLHPQWAQSLREKTGVDNGYRQCGGIYLAQSATESATLLGWRQWLEQRRIAVERLTAQSLREIEPALTPLIETGRLRAAYRLPEEAQLRNPRHLKALIAACIRGGVVLSEGDDVHDFVVDRNRVQRVITSTGEWFADKVCVASGAWTGPLLQSRKLQTGVLPVRGQMIMYRFPQPPFRHIINEGSRYAVARDDGRVLVGSTEEEAGFDKQTTAEGLADLRAFARGLSPSFGDATIESSWAGLRPGTFDGLPYLGAAPHLENLFVASGHFRSGLSLSPATAVVMAELMSGEKPQIDLTPFSIGRG